ncbi:unnamed protein product, partial [Symbiodinium pilosum]
PEMGATLRFQVEGSMDVMIARATTIIGSADSPPSSIDGILNIMRGLAPKDGEVPFVKNMWRGTLHPGHVLFTPA